MSKIKRHLITSALPYANGPLHLGHLAGAYLPADIYVRYLRLLGKDVLWVCGSDEHGAAITIRAKKDGVSPKVIIDKYHALNKNTFEALVFLLISIIEQVKKFIIKHPKIFLQNFTKKEMNL